MSWFKKAIFDSSKECGEWLPAYKGGAKTCRLSNGSVLEIKFYNATNLFKAFTGGNYQKAAQMWPGIFASDQTGIEFMFHIDRRAEVDNKNKGQAFSVMSKVVQGVQEASQGKEFVVFDVYKEDESGESRQSLYQAIAKRMSSGLGFHQIDTGSENSFLFVSSQLYDQMKKDYRHVDQFEEEDTSEYEEQTSVQRSPGFTQEDEDMLNQLYS